MSRFIAIPVQAGDAFYLERDGRSVLVDGGQSKLAFPELFRHHVNRRGVDIVACTHNDADHANGIIGFLEAGLSCREIWLPGRWLDSLKDLLASRSDFGREIIDGAIEYWEEAKKRQNVPRSLEEIGANLLERGDSRIKAEVTEEATGWTHYSIDHEYDYDEEAEAVDWEPWWDWHIPRALVSISRPRSAFWKIVSEAIEAGDRIRRIAKLAFDNGIPVRWFEYDPHFNCGGIPGFLFPLGARQIVRVYPYMRLFYRLALTVVNKESLVLYSPPDLRSPGVLFCADSDLYNMALPLKARDLITVPHHGAEANVDAYNIILREIGTDIPSITWVRSDRRTGRRPCSAFINMPGRKFCTVCRTGPPKQRILMIGRNGVWARHSGLSSCRC